jgi:predicted porin
MQILKVSAAVAVLTAAAVSLPTAAFEGDIGYTYAEGGYQRLDIDNFNGKGNGGFFGGSVQVHESAFLSAGYDFADLGRGVDVRTLELAAGVRYPMTRDLDAVLQLGYIDGKVDTRFGDFNDDGFFVSGGMRWMLTELVELNAAVKYVDLDESGDDWVFSLGGLVEVRSNIALLGGLEFADGADILRLGLRYYF